VMYVNTCMEDLLTLPDAKNIYHIANGEGAARDRGTAKELLLADLKDLMEVILKTFTEEFIFIVFSAGGGTGSGSAPTLIKVLSQMFPERKIGAITILPSAKESLKTLYNSSQCLKELGELNMSSVFIIDNNGKPDKFALNTVFVDLFLNMLKMPSYLDTRGNIDIRDLKEVLSMPGCAVISTLPAGQCTTPRLIDSLRNGIFARPDDDGMVRSIALSLASDINIDAFIKIIGRPMDLFQGYNDEATICVLSGLSMPSTAKTEIETTFVEEQTAMKKLWDAPKPAYQQDDIDLYQFKKENKPKAAVSLAEIFETFRSNS